MYHLKIRNEVEKIELQKNEFCNSLSGMTVGTLFLGPTGSGKTTLIEFLLNKLLIIDVKHGNPCLNSLSNNIDNGPNSKTKEIVIYSTDDNQLYIDTPGFRDTYGEYTEIGNYIAIENIFQCRNIKGFKIGLILPKSVLFYETNRNRDFINFIKAIKNFMPTIGSKPWINEAFIVVTKTEKRTTTDDVIKALASAIKENNLNSNEWEFLDNIINNKKVTLFPLPEEPYNVGGTFKNQEASENIAQLIKQSTYIELKKEDLKKFDLSLTFDGEVLKDISIAKNEIINQIKVVVSEIRDYQQKIIAAFPTNSFNVANYKIKKKNLENYLSNEKTYCDSSERIIYNLVMDHFDGSRKLIDIFCELDYSIKFMKKIKSFNEGLIDTNDIKNQFHDAIRPVIAIYNWKICTSNSYKALFHFFKKDVNTHKKSIDTLLEHGYDIINLFDYTRDRKDVLLQLFNRCSTIKEEVEGLLELTFLNESNAMNRLAEFVTRKDQLGYNECKITGNVPRVSQISFDSDELVLCEEIAIYGRYGIRIDESIERELRGKNLIMIAPTIKVIGDQKIILSGIAGKNHTVLEANEGKDGLAGNVGKSSGSFWGYCYNKIGDMLKIEAEGGQGGDGQNGSKGEDRKKSAADKGYMLGSDRSDLVYSKKLLHDKLEGVTYNWYKVTRFSDNGEPGVKGGDGRTGGEGGKGGFSGRIDFRVLNTDGFEKHIFIVNDGINGKNGNPGKGGKGGEHGDAVQGIWHYPECTPVFFFCKLWSPQGYWEEGHEPELRVSQKAIASDGEPGSAISFHKSNNPIKKAEILYEEHKVEYMSFMLSENSDVFEFYESNVLTTCNIIEDGYYSCF